MAVPAPHRRLGSTITALVTALAALTAACGNPGSSSPTPAPTRSVTDARLATGLIDAAAVRTMLNDPAISMPSPPPFRLADVHDIHATCDNGLQGAFFWLVPTRQLVGIEISINAVQPTTPNDVLDVLAAIPAGLHTDPQTAIAHSMQQCGTTAATVGIPVQGTTATAMRVLWGVEHDLTGYIVVEPINGYLAIAATAHSHTDSDPSPSPLDAVTISTVLAKAHTVLGQ